MNASENKYCSSFCIVVGISSFPWFQFAQDQHSNFHKQLRALILSLETESVSQGVCLMWVGTVSLKPSDFGMLAALRLAARAGDRYASVIKSLNHVKE